MLILCFFASLSLFADSNIAKNRSVPKSFLCWEELLSYFDGNVTITRNLANTQAPSAPTFSNMIGIASINGFDKQIDINGVSYFAKYIGNSLISSNAGPVEDVKFVISIANGQTHSTTNSTTTCGAAKTPSAVNLLSAVLNSFNIQAGLNTSGQKCETVSESTTYSFPGNCAGYNSSSFYIGTAYDLYRYTYEIAPSLRDTAALGQCRRECTLLPLSADEIEACLNSCEEYYPDAPNINSASTYNIEVYIPRPISWSVCSNG